MLNIVVENKNLELTALKDEFIEQKNNKSGESCSNIFKCDQCDFTTESKNGLKIHMGRMHEVKCDACNEKFGGERKLKAHMCRIHVENPTSHIDSLYMKNWYIKNECIRLFCKEQNKHVAILHSKECIEENPCPDVPPKFKYEVTVKDVEGMIHLHAAPYIDNKTVEWHFINTNIFHIDHVW